VLVILPLFAFLTIFLVIGNIKPETGWRQTLLRAGLLSGFYLILLTETLSLVRGITPIGLAIAWAAPITIGAAILILRVRGGESLRFPRVQIPENAIERLLMLFVISIVVVIAVVAWVTPPQTWDSLNYHLARIAHWAQLQAVRHYVTGVEVQNSMPPGGEMIGLHVYVLSGGDRWVPFVQWFMMMGSFVGVSFIAAQLGASRLGQQMAVVFAASLPMGIIQGSSTVTDYVVAFWMICLASEAISVYLDRDTAIGVIFASLATSLTLVTKPTGVVYAFPFVLMVLISLVRRWSIARIFRYGVIAVTIVIVLNVGYLARNTTLFGNPIASTTRISAHVNQTISARVLLSNTLRNAGLQAGTPSPHLNKGITLVIAKVHEIIGIDLVDPLTTIGKRFKVPFPNTNEDRATNPLHAYTLLVLFIILVIRRERVARVVAIYSIYTFATFLMMSLLIKWENFNGRLHLPFFILLSPIAGTLITQLFSTKNARFMGVIFLLASIPWLVGIQSRPLISTSDSYVESILTVPREKLYFVNGGDLEEPYKEITDILRESTCTDLGIRMFGNAAEYPLWALLDSPKREYRVEWLDSGITSRYADPDFEPCAVLCQGCDDDQSRYRNLPIVYQHRSTGIQFYLAPDTPITETTNP
jgi:hypothetical protein